MNQTLRDAFARLQDDAGRFDVDLRALVDGGETRLRRRRLTAVLGGTVAVVVAITVGVGIAINGPTTHSQGPAHLPPAHGTKDAGTGGTPPTRRIVYSDTKTGIVPAVHFGDRLVRTGNSHVHLDVTDDGFLYTDRGGVWFSDGGTPERVGSIGCPAGAHGELGNFDTAAVMTAESGSTAAWLDCTLPAGPTLVVFDTSSQHEVARQPVPSCCDVLDVTSDYVYVGNSRFDLRTRRLRASTPREYAEDLRSHPRGLVLGDDWQSGTPLTRDGRILGGDWQLRFAVAGSRLVPVISLNDREQATSAFDTATRRVLRLRLPAGYHAETGGDFTVFEWLDDDTIALFGGGRADILACHLSSGRCVLAVPGPDAATSRIVPIFPLPG